MIATLELVEPMAKSSEPSKPKVGSAKVEYELLQKARILCIRNDASLQDYLDKILRPVVERDYAAKFGK